MADLSPIATEVLAELQPVLADLARMRSNGSSGIAIDQGTVTSVDRVTGRCTVTLDSGAVNASATCSGYVPAPRERVWVKFVQPAGLVVDGRVHGQPGLLGWGQAVADVPVSQVAGVTICSAVAPVQADRLIRITAHIGQVSDTTGFAQATSAWIAEAGVFIATVGRRDLIGLGSESIDGHVDLIAPLAGLHTYDLVVAMSLGTGTVLAQPIGTTPGPATVVVEDVGSANV